MRGAAAVGLAAALLALGAGRAAAVEEPKYDMTTYQLALLVEGPDTTALPAPLEAKTQADHLQYLKSLIEDGRVLVAGPIEDPGRIRGVVVLDVPTKEEAAAILAVDPWVRVGRLAPEIHPWFAARGILRRATDFADLSGCWLGLLQRPADAPAFPPAELEEIQRGHMANIRRMADSGDLVIAGPMGDDGTLRGIFVFRTPERDKVRELAAADPALEQRRLELELLRWLVPAGALPGR